MPLTDKDREIAREVLSRRWLTIDQVTAVKEAVEKTGMSFQEAAQAKGFLSPARVSQIGQKPAAKTLAAKPSSFYPFLLLTTISMILAGGVYLYAWYEKRENRRETAVRDQRREADRSVQASTNQIKNNFRMEKEQRREKFAKRARASLEKAGGLREKHQKVLVDGLIENAIELYTRALLIFLDPKLLEERANAYQLRGSFPEAIADLHHAARISPKKADYYRKRATVIEKKLPPGIRKQ